MVVDDDLPKAVGHDASRLRIFHTLDVATDVCLYGRLLEGTVALGIKGAVFEYEILGIAERLLARDVTVDQTQTAGMPSEVLAMEFGVVDGDILHLPKRIFGINLGVVYLYVTTILEHILGIALQTIDADIAAMHEGIGTLVEHHIVQGQSADAPKGLIGIVDGDIFEREVVHLAEEFRAVDHTVPHRHVIGIPDGRARSGCKITILDERTVNVPQRIFAFKVAIAANDVAARLHARLTEGDTHMVEQSVVCIEEGTFAAKNLILYRFHIK